MPLFSKTDNKSATRLKSNPEVVLFAYPNAVGVTKAWISARRGRVPSSETTTEEPVELGKRSSKKIAEGLLTSANPSFFISNIPISLAAPKRFFTDLKIRYEWCPSPSK